MTKIIPIQVIRYVGQLSEIIIKCAKEHNVVAKTPVWVRVEKDGPLVPISSVNMAFTTPGGWAMVIELNKDAPRDH